MDVQLKTFERMVMANPVVATIVQRIPELRLPDCWLAAGSLFQTVWNTLSGRDLQAGILDYDINYFDASDLSWDAEDRAIRRATDLFADSRSPSKFATRPECTFGMKRSTGPHARHIAIRRTPYLPSPIAVHAWPCERAATACRSMRRSASPTSSA